MIRRDAANISITPTLDTSAYASGDVLFVPTKLSNVTLETKGSSNLRTINILDLNDQKQAIDLLFFDEDPGDIGAANAALAMSDAEFASFIGRVSIATGDYVSGNANASVTKLLEMLIVAKTKSKDIWVAGVCRSGTPTYAANGLVFKFMLERY